jgi:hypothetical protein
MDHKEVDTTERARQHKLRGDTASLSEASSRTQDQKDSQIHSVDL